QLEKKLDEAMFFRINRAQIINLNFIDKISIAAGGRMNILLTTGEVFEVSERQSVKLKNMGRT
ncbi:MAG TPA: LytTR family DNA-binding domain-containing protein, partial [Mucilaginibacter sp.]|nr:LytTR family DNA-binding domain-containing protein [Mucilaginibacter sp.]